MSIHSFKLQRAIQDFQAARQRAAMQEILARFTGKSTQLLSYEDVAEKLRLQGRTERGIRTIPLDAIVGSVGRYTDFTRGFLPRREEDRQRWVRLKTAMEDGLDVPPIEVYKVGEVYFVVDGNHRVSIARQLGATTIEARVIELNTVIRLTPDVQADDLIIQAEYAEFLDATRLHELHPGVDLSVTSCCQYDTLMAHIHAQQYLIQDETSHGGTVSLQEAAACWYDNDYTPLAEAIRDRGLLRGFPGRTITDLYIWISENRAALEQELGWEIRSDAAATDLILQRSARDEAGSWRRARTVSRYIDHLFTEILVPLSGAPESWDALEQAIAIAQREEAKIHGLHVVESDEAMESPASLAVRSEFEQRCTLAGVDGRLAVEAGEVAGTIRKRAAVADLIVLKIMHPPSAGLAVLRSPIRSIIANSSRPVLAVPAGASRLRGALLAYDGSELAREALFVAAYLAEMWKTELVVFTALEGTRVRADVQDYVRRYLDIHEVQADYLVAERVDQLQQAVEERGVELVLMGSHGGSALQQVLVGSELDNMLRQSQVPIFICR